MPIKIFLHPHEKLKWPIGGERLEKLEDKLRDLLINEGFDNFSIYDSYTGNMTTPHGGED